MGFGDDVGATADELARCGRRMVSMGSAFYYLLDCPPRAFSLSLSLSLINHHQHVKLISRNYLEKKRKKKWPRISTGWGSLIKFQFQRRRRSVTMLGVKAKSLSYWCWAHTGIHDVRVFIVVFIFFVGQTGRCPDSAYSGWAIFLLLFIFVLHPMELGGGQRTCKMVALCIVSHKVPP